MRLFSYTLNSESSIFVKNTTFRGRLRVYADDGGAYGKPSCDTTLGQYLGVKEQTNTGRNNIAHIMSLPEIFADYLEQRNKELMRDGE